LKIKNGNDLILIILIYKAFIVIFDFDPTVHFLRIYFAQSFVRYRNNENASYRLPSALWDVPYIVSQYEYAHTKQYSILINWRLGVCEQHDSPDANECIILSGMLHYVTHVTDIHMYVYTYIRHACTPSVANHLSMSILYEKYNK
jgi:hypothetical protein